MKYSEDSILSLTKSSGKRTIYGRRYVYPAKVATITALMVCNLFSA